MAKGLVIPFSLDPREWSRGLRVVEQDLEGMDDSFKDLERAADQSADNVADAFDGVGDSISDSFKDVGRRASTALDDIPKRARKAADDTGHAMRGARLKEVGGEAGAEIVEGFGEAVRSGNPASVIGETFSSAAMIGAAAGPIGALAGMGVAMAAGLVQGFMSKASESRKAMTDSVLTTFDAATDNFQQTGRDLSDALTKGFVERQDANEALMAQTGSDTMSGAFGKVEADAAKAGASVEVVMAALLGQKAPLDEISRLWSDQTDKSSLQAETLKTIIDRGATRRVQLEEQAGHEETLAGWTNITADAAERAKNATNNTHVPDASGSAKDWERIAAAAEAAQVSINGIPTHKNVKITYSSGGLPDVPGFDPDNLPLMATLDAIPDPEHARVVLTAEGITGTGPWKINRLDPDGRTRPVRMTSGGLVPTAGGWVGSDFEVALNRPVTYTLLDGTTVLATVEQVILVTEVPWLTHPGQPALSRPVTVVNQEDTTWAGRGGRFDVMGRADPMVVTAKRSTRTGTLTLAVNAGTERNDLLRLLGDGQVLLFRSPCEPLIDSYYYLHTGDLTEEPNLRGGDAMTLTRRWSLEYAVCGSPAGYVAGDPFWTWQGVVNTYATWQDVLDAHQTWQDLLEYTAVAEVEVAVDDLSDGPEPPPEAIWGG